MGGQQRRPKRAHLMVGGRTMKKAIYDTLKKVAKGQGVTTYSEIAPLAGLDMSSPNDRNQIAEILGDISKVEHALGHPMLSVVVIHRDNNIPGQGFFTLAKELGLHSGNDDLMFFINELRRAHDFWK